MVWPRPFRCGRKGWEIVVGGSFVTARAGLPAFDSFARTAAAGRDAAFARAGAAQAAGVRSRDGIALGAVLGSAVGSYLESEHGKASVARFAHALGEAARSWFGGGGPEQLPLPFESIAGSVA
jgi:hypothetical protein